MENIVKTPYGVWKCPSCGFTPETESNGITIPNEKPISNQNYIDKILPENPIETITKKEVIYHGFRIVNKRTRTKTQKLKVENKGFPNRDLSLPGLKKDVSRNQNLKEHLLKAVADSTDRTGWASLGDVGIAIRKRYVNFNVRSYGCKKFYELIKMVDLFDIKEQQQKNSSAKLIFIKRKSE